MNSKSDSPQLAVWQGEAAAGERRDRFVHGMLQVESLVYRGPWAIRVPWASRGHTGSRDLERREHDSHDESAEQQAASVADCVNDWVFVEFIARGFHPQAHEPQQQDGDQQP